MKAATEKAFEAYIQETMSARGWICGSNKEWDKNEALFTGYIISFIKDTQADLWARMEKLHGDELTAMLMNTLVKERDIKGTLHIIRHGFKFYSKTFKLAFFKPAHGLVKETMELFEKNRLHVTRQVACHPANNSTVDMVLSINGMPVATMELKNPATGQTWKHAVLQYKNNRDPRAPLFRFKKGAVVHFAVDPDEIHMATKLNREKTFFLPFNRGSAPGEIECGKGNPIHSSGHRTGYFWEEALKRESFLDIVCNYIFLETREETVYDGAGRRKKVTRETMIFPRYHQLNAVRKLIDTARQEQTGNNYLIQHSAGSGIRPTRLTSNW
ncbi:MAG: type I restriction endonuclease subunit R [Spirochaetales bacterium]|nr:type I restriction endonuclease subunit R [Spirochaetales bacterium]